MFIHFFVVVNVYVFDLVCQSYFVLFLSVDVLLDLHKQFVDYESHGEVDQIWDGPSHGVESVWEDEKVE